jgi:carboxypeptidase C (cathepsin A)
VVVKGQRIAYQAIAGLLPIDDHSEEPGAVMSYVAYFRKVEPGAPPRPVIFLYNGGPGSSTMWLHLGAFGPKRIVTGNGLRAPSAPYPLVDNEYCLLDAGDLVFIDAPGTGFGRIVAVDKDKSKEPEKRKALEKDFWSVDPDAKAFAHFITRFLTRYKRWNAPKYLFGESYGTTRSAMLVERLQSQESVDVNGVILLSQILNLGNSIDEPQFAPGDDMPYVLALPTYAATAWYHRKLPAHAERSPEALQSLLAEVRRFALGDYLQALAAGNAIDPAVKHATAQRLAGYIGLPVAYLEKADLRVNGGMFTNTLLGDEGQSVGRLDTRYAGPSLDRLAKESDYDPQSAAISSAYVSAYNDYVRNTLKFGADLVYKPSAEVWSAWEWKHRPPGAEHPMQNTLNVMPDLAAAMSRNPKLRVSVHAGIFDLATPFFAAEYELDHLPIGASLRANIEVHRYPAGHMMYDDPASLSTLHDSVAKFVRETDNLAH